MARLPTEGADTGTWGGILNTFLGVALDASGTIAGSSAVITGQTSLQNLYASSLAMDNFQSTGTGSVGFFNVSSDAVIEAGSTAFWNMSSEAVVERLTGSARWTDIACISHANTTVTVSAAAITLTAECQLTIKSPSNPQSVPIVMVDSIVDDTSFMIVANTGAESALPIMFTIVR